MFSSYIYVEEAAEFLQKLSANESREADSKIRRRATIHTTFWAETGYAYWRHWALFWCCVNLSAWHVDADVRPRVRLCPPGTQNRLIFFSLFLPPHTKQDQYTAYFFLPTYLWNWKWTCVSSKPIWTNQPCGKLPLNVFDNEKKILNSERSARSFHTMCNGISITNFSRAHFTIICIFTTARSKTFLHECFTCAIYRGEYTLIRTSFPALFKNDKDTTIRRRSSCK